MPRNRAEYVRRRMRQTDNNIEKAIGYLAEIYKTLVLTDHQYESGECLMYMMILDSIRRNHLRWYRRVWAGSERDLWTPGSLDDIIEAADPVPDPNYD